ncbi:DEAD-box type RNA helicase [Entophlyctis luteolus]|nr:DEAD-box type RNA helicase [Entophlyctis luteolus]
MATAGEESFHPFHSNSCGPELAAARWASLDQRSPESSRFVDAVTGCNECLDAYLSVKPMLSQPDRQALFLHDKKRVCAALRSAVELPAQDFRRNFNTIAAEVLRFPECLLDSEVDELFVRSLIDSQKTKVLKFKRSAGILPGLVILAAHNVDEVRNWAVAALAGAESGCLASASDVTGLTTEIRAVLQQLTFGESVNDCPPYNFSKTISHIWTCVAAILRCCANDAVTAILDMSPAFDDLVWKSLYTTSDIQEIFPQVLMCFSKLRECVAVKSDCSAKECLQLFDMITESSWFRMIINTSLWQSERHLFDSADIFASCFSWIPSIFDCLHKKSLLAGSNTAKNLLTKLLDDCNTWTEIAKNEFCQSVLFPILAKHEDYSFSLSKDLIDKACSICIRWMGQETNVVLNHIVAESLTSDIDTLEQTFQDIYRDCTDFDEIGLGSPGILHTEIWKSLAAVSSITESHSWIFNHVFKLFGRIYLLDHIKLPVSVEESLTDARRKHLRDFCTSISLVWHVVQHGLRIPSAARSVSVSDMLYCLVCRSDGISSLSQNILLKMADAQDYSIMVDWVLRDEEEEKVDIIINILNTFRDLCSMGQGPPLLGCAERIQSLLKHVYHLIFTGEESYRFNDFKANLWIKSWPFVSSILSSSVKWAKEDQSINKDIKVIVGQTLEIMKQLLANSNVLTTDELCMNAREPFMNVVWSIFQWYRVLDDRIREEAVNVTVAYFQIADGLKYVLDDALVDSVLQYANGSVRSRLSDSQKKTLETWVTKMFDKQEAKRVKAIASAVAIEAESSQPAWNDDISHSANASSVRRKLSMDATGGPSKFLKTEAAKVPIVELARKALPSIPVQPKRQLPMAQGHPSKLQILRQEHFNQQRRLEMSRQIGRTKATILSRADSSDDSDTDRKPVATSIKLIDDGKVVELDAHKRSLAQNKKPILPLPKKKIQTRLRNLNELYKILLQWKIEDTGDIPAGFPFDLTNIPDRFESNDEYANVFEPLLVLECWEQFKSSVEMTDFSKTFMWTVDTCMMIDEFHDVTFVQPFEDSKNKIMESDLVYLTQAGTTHKSKDRKSCLGKVQKMFVRKGEATYIVRVFLKNQHMLVPLLFENSKWAALSLFSLTPSLREYEALLLLPKAALAPEIVQPLFRKKFVPKEGSVEKMMQVFGANRPQAEAIATATQRPNGFVLIQGPPGTGKTKTILSLVGSLLTNAATAISAPGGAIRPPGGGTSIKVPGAAAVRAPAASTAGRGQPAPVRMGGQPNTTSKKNRLLICAPSNAACDEIVRRMKAGILNAQGKQFVPKIVRLGGSESIGVDIRDLTIESLIKQQLAIDPEFKKVSTEVNDSSQWEALEKHQTELLKEREELRAKEQKEVSNLKQLELVKNAINRVSEKLKTVDEKFKAIKQKRLEREGSADHIKARVKASVLLDADVIMATLSGAGHEIVSTLQNFEFPTVIIDEACQSVELSSLIPLRYGAKKCILVGDPMQLPPTVLSTTAKKYGESVCLLRELRERHSLYNPDEVIACVNFVAKLCLSFPKKSFASRIGVITPYRGQMLKIQEKFKERFGSDILNYIDVNTIDAFQGREKDIIILSTVRAGLGTAIGFLRDRRRMNVALTRRRFSV